MFWTSRSVRVMPNMTVSCSSLMSCFPGIMIRYILNDFVMVPLSPVLTGITFVFTFNMGFVCIDLYFLASFLFTFIIIIIRMWMDWDGWATNRFSAGQEIPRILWNPEFHYRIHTCPPSVVILSQLDPFHTPTSHWRSSLILSFHLRQGLSSGLFPSGIPTKTIYTCYMLRPSNFFPFYHPHNIGWGVQIIKFLIT